MVDEKPQMIRVPVLLSAEDLAALDDWQFANRIRTRTDAIRELIRRATQEMKDRPSGAK